jgi:hypothetical protein
MIKISGCCLVTVLTKVYDSVFVKKERVNMILKKSFLF